MKSRVTFDPESTKSKGAATQQRPPDIGMALGDVIERSIDAPGTVGGGALRPRRTRKSISATTDDDLSVQSKNTGSNPPAPEGVVTGGFPKAPRRSVLGTGAIKTLKYVVGGVTEANSMDVPPPHVDRNALYANALYGEGVSTLHPKNDRPVSQNSGKVALVSESASSANSLFASAAPLTQDLTEEDLKITGAILSNRDISCELSKLIHLGFVETSANSDAPVGRTNTYSQANWSVTRPEFLASTLRLILKLLRSPVLSHNASGVKLLSALCETEPSCWMAVLWGGGGGSGSERLTQQKTTLPKSDANMLFLHDNYDKIHNYLTESGQAPSAAMQAQLRFGAVGTGSLLAETTTPFQEDWTAATPNSMEWPASSSAKSQIDSLAHQQRVYSYHKALSPARILDTLIHKNLRDACGYKRPCPNLTQLASLLKLFSDGLALRPNTWCDIISGEVLDVEGGAASCSPHPRVLAGLTASTTLTKESRSAKEAPRREAGVDHDKIDEMLAGSKGDGNRSSAFVELGLVSVVFECVVPLLKEAHSFGGDDEGHGNATVDTRAALSVIWSLLNDPLVAAKDIVAEYILDTVAVRGYTVDDGDARGPSLRYHARHYDGFMSLFDTFVVKNVVLASVSAGVGSRRLADDVALACSVLSRVCYAVLGIAVGSCREGSSSAAHTAIASQLLNKAADTVAVISALLDGATDLSETDSNAATFSLLGLCTCVMQCFVYAADMSDGVEGDSSLWSWAVSSGEAFLHVCSSAVSGYLMGISPNGAPARRSTAAASLLIRPFLTDRLLTGAKQSSTSRFATDGGHSHGTDAQAKKSVETARVWALRMEELYSSSSVVDSLVQVVRDGALLDRNSPLAERVEVDLACGTLEMLIKHAVMLSDKDLLNVKEKVPMLFTEARHTVLQVATNFLANGNLLPYVARMSIEDQEDSTNAMQTTAMALQSRIISEWSEKGTTGTYRLASSALPRFDVIVSSGCFTLLSALLSHRSSLVSDEIIREEFLGKAVKTMLSMDTSHTSVKRTLCLPLLSTFQIRSLLALGDLIVSHSVRGDVVLRQFSILMCVILSHPDHKHYAPLEVVGRYAFYAGHNSNNKNNVFSGSDRFLFSLLLSYLQRHHSLPKTVDGEEDDEEETAEKRDEASSKFSNIFAFRDPPLEWFYSEGQVYREAALDDAEGDDAEERNVVGAVLEEESRVLFSRNHYNERQCFSAWLVWLAEVVRSVSGELSARSVSFTLLHLDELLINVWLWRLRLVGAGVAISSTEVNEYRAAIIPPSENEPNKAVAELHTIHVGDACDALLSALTNALGLSKARDTTQSANTNHCRLRIRSGPLQKVIDNMPNITATLGFVPVPSAVINVALALLWSSRPPNVVVVGGVKDETSQPNHSQLKAQRLRAQVFLTLTRLLCVVEHQRNKALLGSDVCDDSHSAQGADACCDEPQWMAWNSQQFTDVILAAGPSFKRFAKEELPPALNIVANTLSSQIKSAVPRVLINQQSHVTHRGNYRWGSEASEAVWELMDELGLASLISTA